MVKEPGTEIMLFQDFTESLSRTLYNITGDLETVSTKNYEFEARIFSGRREDRDRQEGFFVSLDHWNKVKAALEAQNLPSTTATIRTISFGHHPDRFRLIEEDGVRTLVLEKKSPYPPIIDNEFWTRYSISEEAVVSEMTSDVGNTLRKISSGVFFQTSTQDIKDLSRADQFFLTALNKRIEFQEAKLRAGRFERLIRRTSYTPTSAAYGGLVRVDLSEVLNSLGETTYEVEIEMLRLAQNRNRVKDFVVFCRKIVGLFRGTELSYSWEVYKQFCAMINTRTAPVTSLENLSSFIDKNLFNQVRTLKKTDLVWGGLIGGEKTYGVSYKTDGERCVLVLSALGIWLISLPYGYNLISNQLLFRNEELTILDGESIPMDSRLNEDDRNYKYVYEVFDAMFVRGTDVRTLDLTDRLATARDYLNSIYLNGLLSTLLSIRIKKIWSFNTVDEFFLKIKLALEEDVPYKTDGLTFTPWNAPYWTGIDIDNDSTARTLKDKPEIVKWKNARDTTIDFRYKIIGGKPLLLVTEWEQSPETGKKLSKDIPFVGDSTYPFDQEKMVDWDDVATHAKEDSIGEYSFNRQKKQFVFLRSRDSKAHPNTNETVAIPNWREINSPITQEAITGESFQLMFYYHSRIKSDLMNTGESTLLDLGSGRGGVVWRWTKYDRIVAVEPSKEHIEKFRRRCKLAGLVVIDEDEELPVDAKRFVIIVNGYAQETERIEKQVRRIAPKGVNTVSLLDVGTFLWETDAILKDAMNTIKTCLAPGGQFVWKMMNGELVRPLLSTRRAGEQFLRYGNFELKYTVERTRKVSPQIEVFIPEGITTEGDKEGWQTEWLTDVQQMYEEHFPDYEKVKRAMANDETFMTAEAYKLSSLFEYGILKKQGKLEKTKATTETTVTRRFAPRGGSVNGGRSFTGGRGRGNPIQKMISSGTSEQRTTERRAPKGESPFVNIFNI